MYRPVFKGKVPHDNSMGALAREPCNDVSVNDTPRTTVTFFGVGHDSQPGLRPKADTRKGPPYSFPGVRSAPQGLPSYLAAFARTTITLA